MIGRLNHVGIATLSIDKSLDVYRGLLGAARIGETFVLETSGVRVCFVDLPNTQIELIEPFGDHSPITRFLQKNPAGGQHHVCFEVVDIGAAVARLREQQTVMLGEPRIGAHGTPVVFLHPGNTGGVLIELMETPREAHR